MCCAVYDINVSELRVSFSLESFRSHSLFGLGLKNYNEMARKINLVQISDSYTDAGLQVQRCNMY